MLLLALMMVLSAAGVPVLLSRKPLSGLILFFSVFGLMWITALLFPPVASWITAALGIFILVFVRTVKEEPTPGLRLTASLVLGALAFHFTLALFDLAMSTREFTSDKALLLAAVERSVSVPNLRPMAALLASTALGAIAGHWLGIQSTKRTDLLRKRVHKP